MKIEIALPWQVAAVWGQIISGVMEQHRPYPMDNWGTGRDELANAFIEPMGQLWGLLTDAERFEVMGFPGDTEFSVLVELAEVIARHINNNAAFPEKTEDIIKRALARWGEK